MRAGSGGRRDHPLPGVDGHGAPRLRAVQGEVTTLLPTPVLWPGRDGRRVYLPAGGWYDGRQDDHSPGSPLIPGGRSLQAPAPLTTALPGYPRAGSIIPV